MISSQRIPVERGQFVIEGTTVRATAPYTANVKFVGTGWSSPSYDAPVNVTIFVDGSAVKTWRMVHDTPNVVGEDVYGEIHRLFAQLYENYNFTFDIVDTTDRDAVGDTSTSAWTNAIGRSGPGDCISSPTDSDTRSRFVFGCNSVPGEIVKIYSGLADLLSSLLRGIYG